MSQRGKAVDDVYSQNEAEWLKNQLISIQDNHKLMLRGMDKSNINDAIKYAALIADELRTTMLTPKKYYELYIEVSNKLRDLEMYVSEQQRKGVSMIELYERVQYQPNVLSRLYLLIVVGSVYIKSGQAPAKSVLRDLVEMSKGVQHPMRGLFLRSYLSQMTKDKLPDGSATNIENGTLKDSLEFVLTNFVEMNKLWVRMQYHGSSRDRERREAERKDLQTLVGTNLVNVSNLDGVDDQMYENQILPAILEQVVNCQEAIAQHYLMEIIIQIFPCEFHLISLEKYLACFSKMEDSVDIEDLMMNLINRLAEFCIQNPSKVSKDSNLFEILSTSINHVLKAKKGSIKTYGKLKLYNSLLKLIVALYPAGADYVDNLYGKLLAALEGVSAGSLTNSNEVTLLNDIIIKPLLHGNAVFLKNLATNVTAAAGAATDGSAPASSSTQVFTTRDFLQLKHVSELMLFLGPSGRRECAVNIITALNQCPPVLDSPELLDKIFDFVKPLVSEEGDQSSDDGDVDRFEAEQNAVSRISHMIYHDDVDVHFRLLFTARKQFGKGGLKRARYVLTPLYFVTMKLADRVSALEKQGKDNLVASSNKIFTFLAETAQVLCKNSPELGLRLCCQGMLCADRNNNPTNAYEFMSTATTTYEEGISESRAQFCACRDVIATLQHSQNIDEESYDTLMKKVTHFCTKLVKRPDQARAVSLCSHLFWADRDGEHVYHDGPHVLECLRRAGDIADKITQTNIQPTIFAEILNEHLFYASKNIEESTSSFITAIITFIQQRIPSLDEATQGPMQAYFRNTLQHIRLHQNNTQKPLYQDVTIPGF